jgi:hypothetical protein
MTTSAKGECAALISIAIHFCWINIAFIGIDPDIPEGSQKAWTAYSLSLRETKQRFRIRMPVAVHNDHCISRAMQSIIVGRM